MICKLLYVDRGVSYYSEYRTDRDPADPWKQYSTELSELPEAMRERLVGSVRPEDKKEAEEAYNAKLAKRVEESRLIEEREMYIG